MDPPKQEIIFDSFDALIAEFGTMIADDEQSRQKKPPKPSASQAKDQDNHPQQPIFKPAGVEGIRVFPLAYYAPFQWFPSQGNPPINAQWDDPCRGVPLEERKRYDVAHMKHEMKWQPGSVTCIVKRMADPNSVYMLTIGHAFWDMDRYRGKSSNDDATNGRTPNTLDFWWGEHDMPLVQAIGPYCQSFGQYFRMGDKLGSKVDCALARIRDDVSWSNQCVIFTDKKDHEGLSQPLKWGAPNALNFTLRTPVPELARGRLARLVALDKKWDPNSKQPPEGKYHCREVAIPHTDFGYHEEWHCEFENWVGQYDSVVQRAIVRIRPASNDAGHNQTSVQGGSSGSALIRYIPELSSAVVVGLLLGTCCEYNPAISGDKKIVYDVWQHVSVAQEKLGLDMQLP